MLFHTSPNTFIPPANETDLDRYFRKVKNGEADIVDLLRNIMVRRTRRYVLNQYGKEDVDGRKYLVGVKDDIIRLHHKIDHVDDQVDKVDDKIDMHITWHRKRKK